MDAAGGVLALGTAYPAVLGVMAKSWMQETVTSLKAASTFSGTLAMDWTAEFPTVPGWYWMRIAGSDRHPTVAYINATSTKDFMDPHSQMEWWGPIDAPPESPHVQ